MDTVHVLFIDNFDSFTYNLVDEFAKRDCSTLVYRADLSLEELMQAAEPFEPDLLVISPGPGRPSAAGVSPAAVKAFREVVPIFGVCLGHQVIVEVFGGTVSRAPCVMHGKASRITHCGTGVFEGLENPLHAGRYHSLSASMLPDCLEQTASFEGVVMGVQHRRLPIYGVQFHPESILTPTGGKIIENVLSIAQKEKEKKRSVHSSRRHT